MSHCGTHHLVACFVPGVDVIPWLGSLSNLAPVTDFSESPYGDDNNKTPFPVKPPDRRSYAQNCVVWIKPAGLQVRNPDHFVSSDFIYFPIPSRTCAINNSFEPRKVEKIGRCMLRISYYYYEASDYCICFLVSVSV